MVWESLGIKKGEDIITLLDLIRKVALSKGLTLREGCEKAYSEPIAFYTLDKKLLDLLKEKGIGRQDRPDCNNEIITLVDNNYQEKISGWSPSNYWNFKITEQKTFELKIALSIGFALNIEKRGIVLLPRASGNFLSPADHLPNFRMFKALVEGLGCCTRVAHEIAESDDGKTVVTWTDIGLGGIRRISDLFGEFVGRNVVVKDIAKRQEVFVPSPHPHSQMKNPGDEQFVTEPAQPKFFAVWRKQLENYRSSLVV